MESDIKVKGSYVADDIEMPGNKYQAVALERPPDTVFR
jgi:hypothetical protein